MLWEGLQLEWRSSLVGLSGRDPTPQAGKMRPVSPEEKPNTMQDLNICLRLFW